MRESGFSLLEIVIVVALIGLAMTLATPSMIRLLERQQVRSAIQAVDTGVVALRVSAVRNGHAQSHADFRNHLLGVIPEGWDVDVDEALGITRKGYCSGGRVTVLSPQNRAYPLDLAPGRCMVNRSPG